MGQFYPNWYINSPQSQLKWQICCGNQDYLLILIILHLIHIIKYYIISYKYKHRVFQIEKKIVLNAQKDAKNCRTKAIVKQQQSRREGLDHPNLALTLRQLWRCGTWARIIQKNNGPGREFRNRTTSIRWQWGYHKTYWERSALQ